MNRRFVGIVYALAWSGCAIVSPTKAHAKPSEREGAAGCVVVKRIVLDGLSLLDKTGEREVTAPFVGRCLAIQDIEHVIRKVTQAYIEMGYVAARVYVPEQDLGSGTLRFVVLEGAVEEIQWNGSHKTGRGFVAAAFPGIKGKPLQLRDLERGIRQLSRMKSFSVKSELLPGKKPGGTIIDVKAQRTAPVTGSVFRDNFGSEGTGDVRTGLSLAFDGYLGIGEVVDLSYVRSGSGWLGFSDRPSDDTFRLALTAPLGRATISLSNEYGRYRSGFETPLGTPVNTRGADMTSNFSTIWTLDERLGSETRLSFGLERYQTWNYLHVSGFAEVALATQSHVFASATLGISHDWSSSGYQMHAGASLVQGIGAFGATGKSDPDLGLVEGDAFSVELDASLYKTFEVQQQELRYDVMFTGKLSADELPDYRRLSLGGIGSVRGIQTSLVDANRGAVIRNELSKPLDWSLGSQWGTLEAYTAFDAGTAEAEGELVSMAGVTVGARTRGGRVAFGIAYSDIVFHSGRAWQAKPKTGVVQAELTFRF
ncbi:ShlB/FhaC/HecB family hemolysin secretion/activation protein [Ensifer sp. SL37]|uniref:ShlB/FhaC/HecB family hemolysin secretion/activation protein n=1 Tax=Ensifer sp. SL37 TaxID=2995137 RepID=UPI0022725BDC|nr:ShlB/FhaC/HecB family hemolysin secretion/activation protein [Ensifer sp. SL37]MCY1740785.1 POTRA domain-containing protein [Ensifer sp. SL37]